MKWPQKIRQYDILSKQTGCHPDWERTFLLLHNKMGLGFDPIQIQNQFAPLQLKANPGLLFSPGFIIHFVL